MEWASSLPRFQLAAWTIVLSIILPSSLRRTCDAIFNNADELLGLSACTYLGLKIPEPTKPIGVIDQ